MVEMPVGGDAVVGAVLAHRRDDDAVDELEIGKPDRGKQGTGHVARGFLEGERESERAPKKTARWAESPPSRPGRCPRGGRRSPIRPPYGGRRARSAPARRRLHPPATAQSPPIAGSAK